VVEESPVTQPSGRKLISIVSPVYNEELTIPIFYQRLQTVLGPLRSRYDFEVIFSNNCSTDSTAQQVLKLREQDSTVQLLSLARNFGYEANIATGLRYAHGHAIVLIDPDCEDPPEMITQFIHHWEDGCDVVYGERHRRKEFVLLHLARKAFYRVNRLLADSESLVDMGEFYLITSAVRDAALSNYSSLPFVRSEVAYVGFGRKGIPYERQQRVAGRSNFNLGRIARFAVAAILSSSTFPLRLSIYLFPVLALGNVGLLVADQFHALVALNFLYLAFFLSIACIYLARTYKDVVQRPISVVDWPRSAINAQPPTDPSTSH
jgi:dolichol-phosphate mannosyltransferase